MSLLLQAPLSAIDFYVYIIPAFVTYVKYRCIVLCDMPICAGAMFLSHIQHHGKIRVRTRQNIRLHKPISGFLCCGTNYLRL